MPEHERASVERADAELVRVVRLAREAVDVAPPAAVDVDDAVDLRALREAVQPFHVFLGEPRRVLLQVPEDLRTVERGLAHPPLAVAADPDRRPLEVAQQR